jgi:hypothetical protein
MINFWFDPHHAVFRRCKPCGKRGGDGHIIFGHGFNADFVCRTCIPDPERWHIEWVQNNRPPLNPPPPPPLARGVAAGVVWPPPPPRLVVEQPAPAANAHPAVWPLVVADMQARDAEGRRKYGVPLQPHNGRDALVDAYQESLDQCVYLRQAIYERDGR